MAAFSKGQCADDCTKSRGGLKVDNQMQMSFEECMQKLGEISQKIERGDLPLDETMSLYQQALEFVKICNAKLASAEQQVKQIVEKEDGTIELEDFMPIDGDKNL